MTKARWLLALGVAAAIVVGVLVIWFRGRPSSRAVVTPRGTIVFSRGGPGTTMFPGDVIQPVDLGLYLMAAEGSDVEKLPRIGYETSPAWSPSGDRIAFSAFKPTREGPPIASIYTMDAHGGDVRRITRCEPPHCWGDQDPAWSPSGDRIAFSRSGPSAASIYVVDASGGSPRPLTTASKFSVFSGPSWSPDGTQITFSAYVGTQPPEIYVMGADGRGIHRITDCAPPNCRGGNSGSAWSPDGKELVFVRGWGGWGDIYLMRPDGSNIRQLTRMCKAQGCSPQDSEPAWSPDGSMMVYVRGSGLDGDLYLIRSNGEGSTRLTGGPYVDCCPSWTSR